MKRRAEFNGLFISHWTCCPPLETGGGTPNLSDSSILGSVVNQPESPRAFHVMVKLCGPICNLNCAYCYYLTKENLYHGSDFCMSDEVLDGFTRQYIESQRVQEVTFGWQRGCTSLALTGSWH